MNTTKNFCEFCAITLRDNFLNVMKTRNFSGFMAALKHIRPSSKVLCLSLSIAPLTTSANSIYVGYNQTESNAIVGERQADLTPAGLALYASFDVTDNLSASIDLAKQSDDTNITPNFDVEYDSDTVGFGLNYYLDNWTFSYFFNRWEDELNGRPEANVSMPIIPPNYQQTSDATSNSIQASYYWTQESWQFGLSSGLHFSETDQTIDLFDTTNDTPLNNFNSKSDTTFVSIGASSAWFFDFSEQQLMLGANVSWNHLADDNNIASVSNLRTGSQRVNVGNPLSNVVSGSESYGQLDAYASWQFHENWILDFSTGINIATDDDGLVWSLHLGYLY